MVRMPPGTFTIPHRGIALKGSFYSREVNGKLYFVRWPRNRKAPVTPGEEDNRKLIALASSITKYMSSQEQQFSRELAAVTKLAPRDLLMVSLFNRLGVIILIDGRKIFTMASIQDISAVLDALGQTPGDLLVRGENFWTNIPMGEPGQVLAINEEGEYEWVTLGGGGGSGYFNGMSGSTDYSGGNTTSAFPTKGYVATPTANITITAMNWFVDQANGGDPYRGVVADANPATGQLGANIWLTPTVASGSTDSRCIRSAFTTPVELIGGQSYFFGAQRSTGGGAAPARLSAAGLGFIANAPIVTDLGLVNFALNNLIPGDVPTSIIDTLPQTLWYHVWPEGHFT